MKIMRRVPGATRRTGATGLLCAGVLALGVAMPQMAPAQDAGTVVARVGDTEVTLGHMVALMARLPDQFRQLPDDVLFNGILEQIVDQTALLERATDPLPLRVRLDIDNGRREAIVNDVVMRALDEAITEPALRALYEERYLGAEPEREYNASHILVETEEEALALIAELDEGAEFGTLAREHSRDPGSAGQGGNLGWFGLGRMVPAFEQAVVALQPGQTSAPVQTQFGWHIVRLIDSRQADAPPFEAVRDQLTAELQQATVTALVAEARDGARVELMADGIDPALIRDQRLLADR
jgi:peptidyl-prolyl cis-trans isomerase C